MEAEDVPGWFWEVLDTARPSLSALESWLESQPRGVLEGYALAYLEAAESLVDFSEGVTVDGEVWSEDSTEDLCMWVVGQGRVFWRSTVEGAWELPEVAQAYLGRPSALVREVTQWDDRVRSPGHTGYGTPGTLVHGVYRTRFGQDLYARLTAG
ncbi:hypothetical protein OG373_07365 [Streptomyces avidinii]|uniref:hypothetical protein n=1 Tax=Streptomyces avidinii TaxID=1895 RepID=UPI003868C317|nr:hypothetical protein OG373_07365 [Streptomyces avidinii]